VSATGTASDADEDGTAKAPPWWVVFPALFLGIVLVGGTTFGGYLVKHAGEDGQVSSPPEITPTSVPGGGYDSPSTGGPSAHDPSDWRIELRAAACSSPCSAGAACPARPTKCTSGFTCVPGSGAEPLGLTETWMFHLSAVQELGPDGTRSDPCITRRDFWVCRSGTTDCIAQSDACSNAVAAATSTAALPVTGAEIAAAGVVLDVHEGGPTGPLVATTRPIVRLQRGGLCRGFAVGAVGGRIDKVTYFLQPP
jgi:hypothetical protein